MVERAEVVLVLVADAGWSVCCARIGGAHHHSPLGLPAGSSWSKEEKGFKAQQLHIFDCALQQCWSNPSLPWFNFCLPLAMNWLLLAPLLVTAVRGCPGGQWRWTSVDVDENNKNSRCGSGECVVLEAQCDGQRQCGDGSDEAADQVLDSPDMVLY